MRKYRLVAKKGEGTFSEVLKAQNVKDGRYHAIKCMKNHFDTIEQVNNLREIQALRRLSPHQHIITLEEVLYDEPTGRLALVFELMDANLYELIRGRRHYLNPNLVRSYMFQLVRALHHMHRKGIFHRDIKPENILIENTSEMGKGLKLADFGSCRGIYSDQPYTEYISTRWYRAPECLLTDGYYGAAMDLWGAGCVFFEITSLYPLFPGTNEIDQINRIHKVMGTPTPQLLAEFKRHGAAHVNFDFPEQKGIGLAQLIPHATPDCVDLMTRLVAYDGKERISAREGLQHAYFKEIRDVEARRQGDERAGPQQKALPTIGGSDRRHRQGGDSVNGAESVRSRVKASTLGHAKHQPAQHHAPHHPHRHQQPHGGGYTNTQRLHQHSTQHHHNSSVASSTGGAEEYLPPISGVTGSHAPKVQQARKAGGEKGVRRKKKLYGSQPYRSAGEHRSTYGRVNVGGTSIHSTSKYGGVAKRGSYQGRRNALEPDVGRAPRGYFEATRKKPLG